MSDLDLFAIGSGGKISGAAPQPAPAQAPTPAATGNGDPLIWTVLGEAGADPEGQRGVASTIVNRAAKLSVHPVEVVGDPDMGYEAWTPEKRADLQKRYPVGSDAYNAAAANVGDIFSGKAPPPYQYDSFYSPTAQKALGRKPPQWDDGTGVDVGGNLFFTGKWTPPTDPDLTKIAGQGQPPADGPALTAVDAQGNLKAQDTGKQFTPAQSKTYQTLTKAGYILTDAPVGSANRPWVQRTATDPIAAGQYFIALDGSLQRVPGGPEEKGGGLSGGFNQGFWGDVPNSFVRHLPGIDDSSYGQTLEANRLLFNAAHGNDLGAQIGRVGGEIAGSLPVMGAGDLALAGVGTGVKTAVPATARAIEFLGGKAGGNLLLRLPSAATRGALEGAGYGFTTSAGSDAPVGEQMKGGAAIGAALGPLGVAGRAVVNKLFNPALKGASPAAQQLIYDTAQRLPVPVPLSQGQISEAPALQLTENAMLKGAKGGAAAQVMRDFGAQQQAALRGNIEAIGGGMAGGAPAARGEGGAVVSDALNTRYDAAKKAVDDAYTKARTASDGAYLPAAERGEMNASVRDALHEYDLSGTPRVKSILDGLDQSPTSSTFTPRDIFDARAKLSKLRGSSDPIEGGAAAKAVGAIDTYVDHALTNDLIKGDPALVSAWRDAIGQRREFGKLFEGGDLINALTARGVHGEGVTLKLSPEDASNYIFGRSDLGNLGKKDLTRDLTRLKGVLGADSPEWNALRSEAFARLAHAGEGAPEAGVPQFSGQRFFKAWQDAKAKNPQIVAALFTPAERQQIDDFATIAQRATTPVKGGDNPSGSGIVVMGMVRKALDTLGAMAGGAIGSTMGPEGGAVGAGAGRAFDAFMRDVGTVLKARKLTAGAAPARVISEPKNNLMGKLAVPVAVTTGNKLMPGSTPVPAY